MIAAILVSHLSGSCLSCHLEQLRACLTTQTLTDHMLQDGLHGLQCLRSGYLTLQHHWLIFLDDLTILKNLLDKTGLHHLTIIGNSIIECHRVDRSYLSLIANRHPRQCGLTPILRAIGSLGVRHTDIRRVVAYQRKL